MLGKPRIFYLFSPTRLINSIKHEHSCKIFKTKLGCYALFGSSHTCMCTKYISKNKCNKADIPHHYPHVSVVWRYDTYCTYTPELSLKYYSTLLFLDTARLITSVLERCSHRVVVAVDECTKLCT